MRPQNDAGAFRSIALINYANLLIQAGQLSYVAQNLCVGCVHAMKTCDATFVCVMRCSCTILT